MNQHPSNPIILHWQQELLDEFQNKQTSELKIIWYKSLANTNITAFASWYCDKYEGLLVYPDYVTYNQDVYVLNKEHRDNNNGVVMFDGIELQDLRCLIERIWRLQYLEFRGTVVIFSTYNIPKRMKLNAEVEFRKLVKKDNEIRIVRKVVKYTK